MFRGVITRIFWLDYKLKMMCLNKDIALLAVHRFFFIYYYNWHMNDNHMITKCHILSVSCIWRAVVTGVLVDRHPTKLHLFRTYEPTLPLVDGIYQRHGNKNRDMQSVKKKTLYRLVPSSGRFIAPDILKQQKFVQIV